MENKYSGFTLLEILLAIFIFSIIMTTLFGAFSMVFSSADVIDKNIAANEMAKSCLIRMTDDLQSIYVTPDIRYSKPEFNSEPDPYRVVGETVSTQGKDFPKLRFTSSAHIPFGKGMTFGVAEILYYVGETEENRIMLRRSDRINFDTPSETDGADPVLCEDIKSLKFTYYDKEGTEHESWDSETAEFKYETPSAIAILLEIGDEYSSFFFTTRVNFPVCRIKSGEDNL
jgi:general secretion pathway protein J